MGGYVNTRSAFDVLPGAIEAIARLSLRFRVAVVTNQQGIALGVTDPSFLRDLHDDLERLVVDSGGESIEFFICPHHRDRDCSCRKPRPGLLDQADRVEPVDWGRSFLVGDGDRDIEAGRERHVTTIKIGEPSEANAHHRVDSLREAAALIERLSSESHSG